MKKSTVLLDDIYIDLGGCLEGVQSKPYLYCSVIISTFHFLNCYLKLKIFKVSSLFSGHLDVMTLISLLFT